MSKRSDKLGPNFHFGINISMYPLQFGGETFMNKKQQNWFLSSHLWLPGHLWISVHSVLLFNVFVSNVDHQWWHHDQNKYFKTWSARPSAFSFPSLLFLERAWKLCPSPNIAKKCELFYSTCWWIIDMALHAISQNHKSSCSMFISLIWFEQYIWKKSTYISQRF